VKVTGKTTKKVSEVAAGKAKVKVVKRRISHPIPKSWPVSSRLSYSVPARNKNASKKIDDSDHFDTLDNTSSSSNDEQTANHTVMDYLRPGTLLQQNCNGCDVFLRKGAVQPSTSSLIPTKNTNNEKGAPKRFLIVFPGRMSLKSPPLPPRAAAAAAPAAADDDRDVDNVNDDDSPVNHPNDDGGAKPTKRNPFAPANPPQLLGRLVSMGGAERKVELRIPFPPSLNHNNDLTVKSNKPHEEQHHQQQEYHQLVLSGRAIPLSGKYIALSFKRTGGKDSASAAAAASTPKNKKMGTGSINCKDIFRSVIVLGECTMLDKNDKTVSVANKEDDVNGHNNKTSMMKICHHYGGSERTLDGGGKSDANTPVGKRSLKATAPNPRKQIRDEDEVVSVADSLNSDDDGDNEENDTVDDSGGNSDDEFIPASEKKRRNASLSNSSSKKKKRAAKESDDASDNDDETPITRKRTPRRSAVNATSVSYVDEDSDVDMSDGSSDKKSHSVTQEIDVEDSDASSIVEEVVPKMKRTAPARAPPKVHTGSKKRKLSAGTSCKDVDESSYIVIDSDDDIKTPKQSSETKYSKAASGSNVATSNSKAKTEQVAPMSSSPLKSVSPRRRKKVSPKKLPPKKSSSIDLDDDPFAFL
jgi:hypothetical protein